ncbi:flagellar hook-associated protein FlgK [Acetivibrio mesophilus]|uniref:Flagellar hook-associated protein 1 n=1 Tax=Acetivibrio mesophilus TaxID=2487273 RepID=A0A4Q0I3J5_9FIRM|nr:flagellar hook-associated protein FlgK [Acetivibrio mesophilus]ODM27322.1 flagellar hook-associated protein FlgK [Clostridium sp. Bc-iso-3]RXE58840.1 flagellar hook-associated protein FlgK [Acetivibrio mesophilus]HHV29565.1 flagellar hook-associated protein FlgK [Clostridium sp.]
MASFFGFNVAVRGLYTAQRNMDVINHNINNINTPGYSRQVAVQSASNPISLFNGTGMLGTGSEVRSIERIRDEYLDYKYWSENVSYGEWKAKKSLLADMEVTFNEPSDSGFNAVMNSFYNSLQELAKDPGSDAVRALVKEQGVTLARYFNNIASHFEELQFDINNQVKTIVTEINSLGSQIAQLNRQIYNSELDGNTANDLRDQRTVLIDSLSGLVNIDVNEIVVGKLPNGRDDKRMVITISGKAFVDNFDLNKLSIRQRADKLNENEDIPNLYEVEWEDGNSLSVRGGELRGLLDVRDGNDGENGSPKYKGIPFYIKKLNEYVRTFAKAFNEGIVGHENVAGHAHGYGTNGNTGIRFFTMFGTDNKPVSSADFMAAGDIDACYEKMTAKNFTVSSDIIDDPRNIATSDTTGEIGNIENINSIIKMRNNVHMFKEGAPEDFMKSVIATLAIDSQQTIRLSSNHKNMVNQITNQRLSDSGVSMDEEVANLVKHYQAYSAAAQMINTMAEVYDILINRVGL